MLAVAKVAALVESTLYTLDSAYAKWALFGEWPVLTILIFLGYAAINRLLVVSSFFEPIFGRIEERGKRLEDEDLSWKDYIYVAINELITVFYTVETAKLISRSNYIVWGFENVTLLNTAAVVLICCGCYDAVYVPFHRTLHVPWLYPWIHKHHHHQAVPFRGTWDGINTHPIEFIFGEFLHLGAIRATSMILPGGLHVIGVLSFLFLAGIMASLNHTRWAVRVPFIFDVRDHDVHHRLPRSNYGQFVMWWDKLFGSFRSYESSYKKSKKNI